MASWLRTSSSGSKRARAANKIISSADTVNLKAVFCGRCNYQ
jgi:hypothetical protein